MAAAVGLFLRGVVLGLGAAAPIGPVNVQIARHTLRRGFGAGFALGCGAVTVDVTYALLTSLGVERLADYAAFQWALRVGGVLLLTYLGVMCFVSARQAWHADPVASAGSPDRSPGRGVAAAYTTGLLMTLLNPMTLAFWFMAVPAMAGPIAGHARNDLAIVCSGVFAGTVSWVVFFAGVLALAGRYRRNWWLAAADVAGGAALLVFAGAALLSSVRAFL
jgi:threonine/homoserine/homoserine lactone efflux protein